MPVADGLEVLDADDLAERPRGDQLLRPQGGGGREIGKAGEGREAPEPRVREEGASSRSEGDSPPPFRKHPCVPCDTPSHPLLPAPLGIARV